nr:hypothetical protein CFP56_34506 [Quercus suber]
MLQLFNHSLTGFYRLCFYASFLQQYVAFSSYSSMEHKTRSGDMLDCNFYFSCLNLFLARVSTGFSVKMLMSLSFIGFYMQKPKEKLILMQVWLQFLSVFSPPFNMIGNNNNKALVPNIEVIMDESYSLVLPQSIPCFLW